MTAQAKALTGGPRHDESEPQGARGRILEAAYKMFTAQGIGVVGIDLIIARADVAKMSLYRHFKSKDDLILAYLDLREQRWTEDWLRAGIDRQKAGPEAALLSIFDLFGRWFRRRDFEGCPFISALLEVRGDTAVHDMAVEKLTNIRLIVQELAEAAGFDEAEALASTWHILMKGSIISASEGEKDAARNARRAGEAILQSWPRKG